MTKQQNDSEKQEMASLLEQQWPKTIPLSRPVMAHDSALDQLVFQEPNGGHLMSLPTTIEGDKNTGGSIKLPTRELASAMANVPPSTIDALCMKDSLEVMKIINPLAIACLETLGT